MAKSLQDLKWQSVALDGFPVANSESFNGFVGLEECTDYGLDAGKKNSKKNKNQKRKRKIEEIPQNVPSKKLKVTNGFIVEYCAKSKPSVTNDNLIKNTTKNKIDKNVEIKENKVKTNKIIKQKLKLGERDLDSTESTVNTEDMLAWSQFQIPEEILKGLAEQGFIKPTKIQELTLPAAMMGRRDILGAAETGSGKTLAFGIPIIAGIMKLKEKQLAGEDVYEIPYKKSSIKKTKVENIEVKTIKKPKKRPVKKNTHSREDTKDDSDSESNNEDEDNDNESDDDDSKVNGDESEANDDESEGESNDSEEEIEREIEVPIRKRSVRNSSDESDDSDNYIHLSEMLDSDDLEASDEENDVVERSEGSDEEIDDHSEGDGSDDDVQDQNGVGCVKVIDNIELPENVVIKTGKPLYALILTPTRELAIQISRHLIAASKYTDIKVAVVVGGMAQVKQERVLSKSPEVVVATPGRLWELIQQGQPHLQQLENIKFLAIDETDRMMERNHFEELTPLLERLNADDARKASRQNFVFSATLTLVHDLPAHMKGKKVTKRGKILNRKVEKMTSQQKVKRLVSMIGMTEPKVVDITTQNLGTADTLTECRITCSLEEKDYYLHYILKRHPGRTIVFCNSIGSVRRLSHLFGLLKCHPLPLHASMPQRQRLKNLERFRDNPHGVLVATDVAARGLDIPNVDHVVHYQVPRTAENYVHRSGRTARATKEGLTILMMEPGEAFLYTKLCRTLNKTSELPSFPVPAASLWAPRRAVSLARELDGLALRRRRAAQDRGWRARAARDMDIIIDEDFLPIDKPTDNNLSKALQVKKKQLDQLLSKPVFPKGFSYKYPTLNDPEALSLGADDNALQVMKRAIESGSLKKDKRKGKNDALLKLERKLKAK